MFGFTHPVFGLTHPVLLLFDVVVPHLATPLLFDADLALEVGISTVEKKGFKLSSVEVGSKQSMKSGNVF